MTLTPEERRELKLRLRKSFILGIPLTVAAIILWPRLAPLVSRETHPSVVAPFLFLIFVLAGPAFLALGFVSLGYDLEEWRAAGGRITPAWLRSALRYEGDLLPWLPGSVALFLAVGVIGNPILALLMISARIGLWQPNPGLVELLFWAVCAGDVVMVCLAANGLYVIARGIDQVYHLKRSDVRNYGASFHIASTYVVNAVYGSAARKRGLQRFCLGAIPPAVTGAVHLVVGLPR